MVTEWARTFTGSEWLNIEVALIEQKYHYQNEIEKAERYGHMMDTPETFIKNYQSKIDGIKALLKKLKTKSNNMKEVEYGKWYPCEEGTMPEDILGYNDNWNGTGVDITPAVIIPYIWDNSMEFGTHTAICRTRVKGNKLFHWELKYARPLYWMAIPPIPIKSKY